MTLPDLSAANIFIWAVCAATAYLAGTIPTAYVVGRWLQGEDIRSLGNGNVGAGNAGRLWGPRIGLLVGAVDVGKGMAAVTLAKWMLDDTAAPMLAGFLVIMGDACPVYLQRRGGRGAAAAGGALLALLPWVAGPTAAVALGILWLTRNTTAALAVYYIAIPFLAFLSDRYPDNWAAYAVAVPALVGVIHFLSLRRELKPG